MLKVFENTLTYSSIINYLSSYYIFYDQENFDYNEITKKISNKFQIEEINLGLLDLFIKNKSPIYRDMEIDEFNNLLKIFDFLIKKSGGTVLKVQNIEASLGLIVIFYGIARNLSEKKLMLLFDVMVENNYKLGVQNLPEDCKEDDNLKEVSCLDIAVKTGKYSLAEKLTNKKALISNELLNLIVDDFVKKKSTRKLLFPNNNYNKVISFLSRNSCKDQKGNNIFHIAAEKGVLESFKDYYNKDLLKTKNHAGKIPSLTYKNKVVYNTNFKL